MVWKGATNDHKEGATLPGCVPLFSGSWHRVFVLSRATIDVPSTFLVMAIQELCAAPNIVLFCLR